MPTEDSFPEGVPSLGGSEGESLGSGVDERRAWITMLSARGLSLTEAHKLIRMHGSPAAVLQASAAGALTPEQQAAIKDVDLEREAAELIRLGARHLTPWCGGYPVSLIGLPDPPGLLRIRGDIPNGPAVAIVGTRRCSRQGEQAAAFFARSLAHAGVTVVSGGARGVDAAAHRGALEAGGLTIAVMGSGLANCYPPEHASLFGQIVEAGGALLSEYAPDQRPRPGFFPRRNRIISGLSIGVLVIEAPPRSGAMGTARIAVESHGRECWALLADPTRRSARGALEAIRDGWARPVLDPADVLADLPRLGLLADEQRRTDTEFTDQIASRSAGEETQTHRAASGAVEGRRCAGPSHQTTGITGTGIPTCRLDLRLLAALVGHGQGQSTQSLAAGLQVELSDVMATLTNLQLLGAIEPTGAGWRTTPAGVAWLGNARAQFEASR
ncbi:MAG: DNA-processing protein DprA [Phycisphaerales bacterium]|nr:DNA-processing protein DprA [Phycisphaerales bacterium]